MSEEFTCYACKQTFVCGQSEEAAMDECHDNFGTVAKQDCDVLCDECYKKFMEWHYHKTQTQ